MEVVSMLEAKCTMGSFLFFATIRVEMTRSGDYNISHKVGKEFLCTQHEILQRLERNRLAFLSSTK